MGVNDQFDEPRLLISLQKGNIEAFEKLYYLYVKKLYGNILRMVKSTEAAEEILQELFQRVWERRETLDANKSFKSYLFTIARHLIYDFLHVQARQRGIEAHLVEKSTSLYQPIDDEMAFKETRALIAKGIRQLPPQRRRVYVLCKIKGKSYEDVSRILGISTSTISDHIVKATKSLKSLYLSEQAFLLALAICFS